MSSMDVQNARILVDRGEDQDPVWLRVEVALDLGDAVLVSGWSSDPAALEMLAHGEKLVTHRLLRAREDVVKALDVIGNEELGFTFLIPSCLVNPVQIEVLGAPNGPIPLDLCSGTSIRGEVLKLPGHERLSLASRLPPFSRAWSHLVAGTPGRPRRDGEVRALLDVVVASPQSAGAVVSGWYLLLDSTTDIWFESSSNAVRPLSEASLRARQDVVDAFSAELSTAPTQPGFTIFVPEVTYGDLVRLRALVDGEVVDLSESQVARLPNEPLEAAKFVFGLAAPTAHRLGDFVRTVAAPALEGVIASRTDAWASQTPEVRTYGQPPAEPEISIIVPLYGRMDFVEHQLIEFYRDPWIIENAELIYVIDDPRLVDQFIGSAPQLHEIYSVPFRAVWGGVNRGYSGANNLGAANASGAKLLFLNSDAFPQSRGWLEELSGALEDESIGAIAPRLLFADGSIQHAGINFRQRGDLGIWVNHHPNMGLDPQLDPAGQDLTEMPAVTGACLLLRRTDFDTVGGWDTGYLIGDFEDSDLCLKLRAVGKRIVYDPRAQLTHLERQSFAMMGESDFRFRVVIYNAIRHQLRWGTMLEESINVH